MKKHGNMLLIKIEDDKERGGLQTIGVNEPRSDIGQIEQSYMEAKTALMYRLLSEGDNVYTHKDTKTNKQFTLPLLDGTLLPFYNTMMKNKPGEAAALVRQLFDGMAEAKGLSVYALLDVCPRLTTTLNSVIEFVNNRSETYEAYMEQPDLFRFVHLQVTENKVVYFIIKSFDFDNKDV